MAGRTTAKTPVDPERAKREQRAAEHPDAWLPIDVGDSITGVMTDLDIGWSDLKEAEYPIVTVELEDGTEKKIHCLGAALHGEVSRKRPLPGETLTFTYHGQGEAKGKGKSGAYIYRLKIAGRGPEQTASMYDRMAANNRRNRGGGGGTPPPPPQTAAAAPGDDDEDVPF